MLQIEPLQIHDIPAARRLSDQANWNHLDADWQRLITLFPDTCLAGRLDGKVIATAALATFPGVVGGDPLAWVGVMLVDIAHRGAGHGSKMFDAILQAGKDRHLQNFGLDATDMGRPLYAKRAFVDRFQIHRWKCPEPLIDRDLPRGVRPLVQNDWPALLAIDQQAAKLDRTPLLKTIAAEPNVKILVAEEGDTLTGYSILRPGRVASYIGPIVAHHLPTAAALFKAAVGTHSDSQIPLFIDTAASVPLTPALIEENFEIARTLTRMARANPNHPLAYTPGIFAIAGLELC